MQRLEIIMPVLHQREVVDLLVANGVKHFTVLEVRDGSGRSHGRHGYGGLLETERHVCLLSYCPDVLSDEIYTGLNDILTRVGGIAALSPATLIAPQTYRPV